MSLPRKLKNFNLFNAGRSYMGEISEVTLPKLTTKMEEYRGGGMDAPIDVDLGMEKLTMEWTCGGYVKQVLEQYGALSHDGVILRFAGALQADDVQEVIPLEVVVRGRHSEIDPGSSKPGDDTEFKVTTSISYYKVTMAGETVIEIDIMNMVKNINGTDLMSDFRMALGL